MRKPALIAALAVSFAALGVAVTAPAAEPPVYDVREIVSPLGLDVIAHDLNDKGQVVGWFATRKYWEWTQPGKAFVYADGVLTNIFPDDPIYSTSDARGINERGQIVGTRFTDGVGVVPFLQENGSTQMLNPFGYTGVGFAYGINESGQIVGRALTADAPFVGHAFVLSAGDTLGTDIHPPGLTVDSYGSEALAVNDAGHAMGAYLKWGDNGNRGDTRDAFYWDGASWRFPDDQLELGATFYVGALNDAGKAAGTIRGWAAENVPRARAAIYDGEAEAIIELAESEGAIASGAHGINDAGVVVGEMGITTSESRAVVWQDGVPYDLNLRLVEPPDVVLSKASAVNGPGQIIAIGVVGQLPFSGRSRSFLLTPATPAGVVGGLVGSVDGLVEAGTLNSGQGRSLLAKLEAALKAIQAGNSTKAVAMLEAFVHEVQAFENAGILTADVAADLVRKAELAISSLSH